MRDLAGQPHVRGPAAGDDDDRGRLPGAPPGRRGDEYVIALLRVQPAHRQHERATVGDAQLLAYLGRRAHRWSEGRRGDGTQPGPRTERGGPVDQVLRRAEGDVRAPGHIALDVAVDLCAYALREHLVVPGDH